MSSLDGLDLFGSGPHAIRPGPWERAVERRSFAGLDGEVILDMGLRSRVITQTGRLQAASAQALQEALAGIESLVDGRVHSLTDNHGQSYLKVLVEYFEPTTPLQRGVRGFWCDYAIRYRQLP